VESRKIAEASRMGRLAYRQTHPTNQSYANKLKEKRDCAMAQDAGLDDPHLDRRLVLIT
jgi:hypothetical protein